MIPPFPDPIIDVQCAAVAGNLYAVLREYGERSGLGVAFPPGLFYALWKDAPDVKAARVPDASFVRHERLSSVRDSLMPFHGAPDFAACVVSQTDPTLFTLAHVRDYLAAGTALVWMIFTEPLFEVHVYDRDQPALIRVYRSDEIIGGDPHLSGFAMAVTDIFKVI